ncbi:MAG TPA: glycoside hydrolase family 2 TIM barrel-domain containing protein [Pilimelia sp.]|nr:glycoside hydrolase family 2 TIM barrel-domain containing protein [Pilimelia sp.]
MEMNRRNVLAAGVVSAGAAGLAATGVRLAGSAEAVTVPGVTETVYLTGTDADNTVPWEFRVAKGRRANVWSTIPTPSNWEMQGFGTYKAGWNLDTGEIGTYRHNFTPPTTWSGRRVFIVFEGSMTDTTVRVNGTQAGATHQGGFYRFRYDITSLLRLGQSNTLEVTVVRDSANNSINEAERRGDYWNFAGIYRPVYLQAHPASRIDRVAINGLASGAFTADLFLAGVSGAARVVGQIKRLDGTNVGSSFTTSVSSGATRVTVNTSVSNPALWSAEAPNLHRVEFRLENTSGALLHTVTERFGFRTVEVRNGSGIYVNGSKVLLKGTNRHTIWPTLGRASSPRLARLDILLMKEMNNNAVRMSHYPPDTFFLDLCDELGLYVIDELAGWQKRYDENVGAPLVASMVQRDVNHPSIVLWANGNEGGWNTALDDDYATHDIQRRRVIHPWANFNGLDTDHYETYDSTRSKLAASAIHLPTEFLHALYDGGGGAGLNDYWNAMLAAPRSAGGFIWAYADEGIVRADRNNVIDVAGNAYPDGIVGPYREKEGSFFAVKDIWSPVQLSNPSYYTATFPTGFTNSVNVTNRFDMTNLQQCAYRWQLVRFAAPSAANTAPTVIASGTATSPSIAPGASGSIPLGLPSNWADADALQFTATGPDGREINSWTWTIKKAADHAGRIVVPATSGTVAVTETSGEVAMTGGNTRVTISKSTGRLTGVTRDGVAVSLNNGPSLATGSATFSRLTHGRDGTGYFVEATYSGDLISVRWRLDASGWLRMDYGYRRTGANNFVGVNLDYPEANVRAVTWLGRGPYRVYKNRMRGVHPGVWSKNYNNAATGASGWQYPEFKGYHADTYWAALRTSQGTITMVTPNEGVFLRLFTPANGPSPMTATAPYPAGGISFLDGIPAIGNKFHTASQLGPESQLYVATGEYRRTVHFRFTA